MTMNLLDNAMINNSMHWGWKVGLIFAVMVSIQMFGESNLDGGEIFGFNLPLAAWIAGRWIVIGKAQRDKLEWPNFPGEDDPNK
jgi:hypothetical protein